MIESGAIALYLVEKYGGKDHPLLGKPETRGKLLQWLFYGPATFYPRITPPYADESFKKDEAKMKALRESFEQTSYPLLNSALENSEYLLGNEFTLADIMMGYYVDSLRFLGWLDEKNHPKLAAYMARLDSRRSFKLAYTPPQ